MTGLGGGCVCSSLLVSGGLFHKVEKERAGRGEEGEERGEGEGSGEKGKGVGEGRGGERGEGRRKGKGEEKREGREEGEEWGGGRQGHIHERLPGPS